MSIAGKHVPGEANSPSDLLSRDGQGDSDASFGFRPEPGLFAGGALVLETGGMGCRAKEDASDTYVEMLEFLSYEEARRTPLPKTSEFAAALASFFKEPPTFRNLDLLR